MPTNVIMPALELAQETGKLLRWIKAPGDTVRKGEPIAEIETDKVTIEIEAPASGVLRDVTAQEGDVVPVGHTIAQIAAPSEAASALSPRREGRVRGPHGSGAPARARRRRAPRPPRSPARSPSSTVSTSPASRPRAARSRRPTCSPSSRASAWSRRRRTARRRASSPRRRRRGGWRRSAAIDLRALKGSGPGGAVLTLDVPAATARPSPPGPSATGPLTLPSPQRGEAGGVGTVWRIMAERMTASWTTRAALLPGARGQRDAAGRVARDGAQADRRARHLHGPAGQAGRGHARPAPARERVVEGRRARASRRHQHRPGRRARGRARRAGAPQRRHARAHGDRRAARGPRGARPGRQAAAGRHPGRRLHDQQPRHVRRGRVQRHRQPAAGRDPGGGPHRRSRRPGQRPAGRAADHGAHAVLRPPRPRRRPRAPSSSGRSRT